MKPKPPAVALILALVFALGAVAAQAGRHGPRTVETPFHRAVEAGDLVAVRKFLDGGGSPDERTYAGMTGLGLAVERGRWEVAGLLLGRGGDPNALVYGVPLPEAVERSGSRKGYDWLVRHGGRPTAPQVR